MTSILVPGTNKTISSEIKGGMAKNEDFIAINIIIISH